MEINPATPVRVFLEMSEARAIYGGSEAWWRKSVYRKRISYFKRGARVVFSRTDLEAYFERRRVPARAEAA